MDELDRRLFLAFWRVWRDCAQDPREAQRRLDQASRSVMLRRPHRAWCIGIRASDTRISRWFGLEKWERARVAHAVTLSPRDIRELCAPVRLRWPGVPIREAADRLGRHVEAVRRWLPVRPGRSRAVRDSANIELSVDYEDAATGWGVRYENPRVHGRQRGGRGGGWVPVVWNRRALDPGHQNAARPAAVWGGVWEGLAGRWPNEAGLWADRAPRDRPRRVRDRASGIVSVRSEPRGWDWVCPGLEPPRRDGASSCGRRAGTLICPLPCWTLGAALADEPNVRHGLTLPDGRRWRPGLDARSHPAAFAEGGLRFACGDCWKVRNQDELTTRQGWNALVRGLSGGLLIGSDVDNPFRESITDADGERTPPTQSPV